MSGPASRRRRLLRELAARSADAALLTSPVHLRYLTGFSGEGLLLLRPRASVLITDRRYEVEARERTSGLRVFAQNRPYLTTLLEVLQDPRPGRVLFEAEHLTCAQHQRLVKGLKGVKWQAGERLVAPLRERKDPGEIALIVRAAEIADAALAEVVPRLRAGMTEQRIAWRLTQAMLEAGAEGPAFSLIVASGPRSALPHAQVTDRPLGRGEPLVLDLGARVDGYCSDITRTLVLGRPSREFRARYAAVLAAQQAAIAVARAGVPAAEVDAAAREVLTAAGMGEQFSHGLGHGVGLEVHEAPSLSAPSTAVLAAGQVITIEPGVYFEGWGGLRLEDLFVVEQRGLRRLTHAAKWGE